MNGPLDPTLLDQVKALLRRDLRLGNDAAIPDDMPLVGGPIDLDSIDILLVVSSIEKQFHIKVPSEVVGRSAFATVGTLTRYVQDNRETLHVVPQADAADAPIDWLAKLPHGPEFRFLSSVREVEPGKAAVGYWHVAGNEVFLAGHFPGRPIVPGVLITEALAQLAGLAANEANLAGGVLAAVDVRFLAAVVPPAYIELQASVGVSRDRLRHCNVIASVGGQPVARGTVTIHFGG